MERVPGVGEGECDAFGWEIQCGRLVGFSSQVLRSMNGGAMVAFRSDSRGGGNSLAGAKLVLRPGTRSDFMQKRYQNVAGFGYDRKSHAASERETTRAVGVWSKFGSDNGFPVIRWGWGGVVTLRFEARYGGLGRGAESRLQTS